MREYTTKIYKSCLVLYSQLIKNKDSSIFHIFHYIQYRVSLHPSVFFFFFIDDNFEN